MRQPDIGDKLYLDAEGRHPVTVISTTRDLTYYVPGHVDLRSTHKGNLYDRTTNGRTTRPYAS